MSQRELARRTGMTQASVSRIERGVVSPSVDTLARLLRECGVDLVAVPRRGDVDRTLIRERIRLTSAQRARLAVAEWRGMAPFRRAARARV
jgi:transcriptional regulator with XRE-family HTH domain